MFGGSFGGTGQIGLAGSIRGEAALREPKANPLPMSDGRFRIRYTFHPTSGPVPYAAEPRGMSKLASCVGGLTSRIWFYLCVILHSERPVDVIWVQEG